MRRRSDPRPQSGYALLAAVALAFALAFTLAAGAARVTLRPAAAPSASAVDDRVAEAAAALQAWYEGASASVDADDTPLTEPDLLRHARASAVPGLRAAGSARLGLPCSEPDSARCIAGRVLVVWQAPADGPDASTFDAATGAFAPGAGVAWRSIDGRALQATRVAATLDQLHDAAGVLTRYFALRQGQDPFGDWTRNHFRARDCARPDFGELPCVDAWTAAGATAVPLAVGLDPARLRSAWGSALELSNLADASQQPPYSLALQARTPWGARLVVSAVQPL